MTNTAFKPFSLGQVVATRGVLDAVNQARMMDGLTRHARGDWGNICQDDWSYNDQSSREGLRILSAYAIDPSQPAKGHGENCFWIITEGDRSATTILLPDEY